MPTQIVLRPCHTCAPTCYSAQGTILPFPSTSLMAASVLSWLSSIDAENVDPVIHLSKKPRINDTPRQPAPGVHKSRATMPLHASHRTRGGKGKEQERDREHTPPRRTSPRRGVPQYAPPPAVVDDEDDEDDEDGGDNADDPTPRRIPSRSRADMMANPPRLSPTPTRSSTASDSPTRSSTSMASSARSRQSSPKRSRTVLITLNIKYVEASRYNMDTCGAPVAALDLLTQVRAYSYGLGILPAKASPELQHGSVNDGEFLAAHFDQTGLRATLGEYPPLNHVDYIIKDSRVCDSHGETEAAWNCESHNPIGKWAERCSAYSASSAWKNVYVSSDLVYVYLESPLT